MGEAGCPSTWWGQLGEAGLDLSGDWTDLAGLFGASSPEFDSSSKCGQELCPEAAVPSPSSSSLSDLGEAGPSWDLGDEAGDLG